MYSKNLEKSARVTILVTLLAVVAMSIVLTLIPFTSGIEEGKNNAIAYIIAAVFWIGLILAFVAAYSTKRVLYRFREKMVAKGLIPRRQPIGVVSFSKDWKMWIIYGITVLGLICIITDVIFTYMPENVMFPIISITILSFAIHCIVDGKYFKAYKLIKESVNNETDH